LQGWALFGKGNPVTKLTHWSFILAIRVVVVVVVAMTTAALAPSLAGGMIAGRWTSFVHVTLKQTIELAARCAPLNP
jgi:hypothetical protein